MGEFIPESERFWEAVPRGAVMERIGINFEFTEGPAWHPRGFLVFSDIPGNTIYRWTGKDFDSYRDSSNNSNGLLFMTGGDLLCCEHGSRSAQDLSRAAGQPDGGASGTGQRSGGDARAVPKFGQRQQRFGLGGEALGLDRRRVRPIPLADSR